MGEDLKSRGDRIIKNLISGLASGNDEGAGTRELLFNILSKAGKGKDEFVQVLGREIGLALAAVLAKPLEQMSETKRIRVTVELVPKAKPRVKRKTRSTK